MYSSTFTKEAFPMYKKYPEDIGSVIQKLFTELGYRERYKRAEVIGAWKDIVGEQVAKVSSAERVIGKKLFVHVSNSAWRHELHLQKKQIIQKVNHYIGTNVIDDIKFH